MDLLRPEDLRAREAFLSLAWHDLRFAYPECGSCSLS